ncbi:MAG: ATP-binding protein [Clostridia bacterium]
MINCITIKFIVIQQRRVRMFIGREKELSTLNQKIDSDKFEFGIVYGRRRIGKTELLKKVVGKAQSNLLCCQ